MAGLKDLDPDLVQQLLATFRAQLEESLSAITDGLLALERSSGPEQHQPLLESMFRAAHNIKGAARGVGLENSADLAHAMEDLFATWKRGTLEAESTAIDLCLGALDALRLLVDSEGLGQDMDERTRRILQNLRDTARGLPPTQPPPEAAEAPPQPAAAGSIRLPVDRLDRIADQAEELQIARIQLNDHLLANEKLFGLTRRLHQVLAKTAAARPSQGHSVAVAHAPDADLLGEAIDLVMELDHLAESQQYNLRTTVSLLRPVAAALREDTRSLRMVPAATLLNPLIRTVRDLARDLGKEARLTLTGENIEMDRMVLDGLRDPLTHLLRNAVDHGIEMPEIRRAEDKPETGHIQVVLAREGGMVRITVSDDGTGIDPESLRLQALQRGLHEKEELVRMTRTALFEFLFRPGFSTREQASTVSGRGVGLDVVRVNLQALNGHVTVDSEPGVGTQFMLDMPLTLASEHGLVIGAGGQLFAIPNQYVTRILELAPEDIADLEATQVVYLDKDPIPLRDLASLLRLGETEPPPAGEPIPVVVVNRGWERVALRVEHIQGEREMVIKPLAPPLDQTPLFAGGTLGLQGGIVLVLEVADLLAAARAPAASGRVVKPSRDRQAAPRILVVDDSITTRTLEESILTSAGYRVSVAADGQSAWEKLRHGNFDLVVTDVEMPGMNGFELAQRIRQDERLEHLPVVVVTSLGSEEDRRRGMEVQADAYIVKSSFESRELLEVLEQLL